MWQLHVALALGLAQLVLCRVCVPDVFEVDEGYTEGYAAGEQRGSIQAYLHVWYDATQKKTAVYEHVTTNGKTTTAFVLQDFNNHTQYVVIDKKCSVSSLGEFTEGCIPDTAKVLGSGFMGLKDKGLPVTYYMYPEGNMTVSTTFTSQKPFFPVGAVLSGNRNGADFMLVIGYSNYVLEIKNPNIFDIPKECLEGAMQKGIPEMSKAANRKSVFYF